MLDSKQAKRARHSYRRAIDIFARKMGDADRELLLEEMISKTQVLSPLQEYLKFSLSDDAEDFVKYVSAISVTFSLTSRIDIEKVLPVVAVLVGAKKAYEAIDALLDYGEGSTYDGSNDIIFRPYFTKETAFHEAIHFLEGKGIIQESGELMSVAATALFCNDSITNLGPTYHKEYHPVRYFFSNHDYEAGDVFAKTVLRIKRKRGESAAWEFLYRKSQEKQDKGSKDD